MIGDWAIAIMSDRYGGTYSHGKWLAIHAWPQHVDDIWAGPYGEDPSGMEFWADPPDWIAVGDTPDEALANLKAKQFSKEAK